MSSPHCPSRSLSDPHRVGRSLDVGFNQLACVPSEVNTWLPSLTKIDARNNLLTAEGVKPLWACTNLTELNLYGNKLEVLSEHVSQLSEIKELSVGWNGLKMVPSTIEQCTKLEVRF